MDNRILEIIQHYGVKNQVDKCVEELDELIVALKHNDIEAIEEEVADVEVMLEQIKHIFKIDELDLDTWKEYKLNRTLVNIDNEKGITKA